VVGVCHVRVPGTPSTAAQAVQHESAQFAAATLPHAPASNQRCISDATTHTPSWKRGVLAFLHPSLVMMRSALLLCLLLVPLSRTTMVSVVGRIQGPQPLFTLMITH
jgi:hypothetical protein